MTDLTKDDLEWLDRIGVNKERIDIIKKNQEDAKIINSFYGDDELPKRCACCNKEYPEITFPATDNVIPICKDCFNSKADAKKWNDLDDVNSKEYFRILNNFSNTAGDNHKIVEQLKKRIEWLDKWLAEHKVYDEGHLYRTYYGERKELQKIMEVKK